MGCWLLIYSGDGLHLWLFGAQVYIILLEMTLLKTVEVRTEYLDYLWGNSITHWRWYLTDKTNIRCKYRISCKNSPGEKYMWSTHSHSNIMIYYFNKFFNTIRKIRVMYCIILFLVWMSLQHRMTWKSLSFHGHSISP